MMKWYFFEEGTLPISGDFEPILFKTIAQPKLGLESDFVFFIQPDRISPLADVYLPEGDVNLYAEPIGIVPIYESSPKFIKGDGSATDENVNSDAAIDSTDRFSTDFWAHLRNKAEKSILEDMVSVHQKITFEKMTKETKHSNDSLIYDVGMHNGDDTAYYLSLGYKVVAIDASPDLVSKAKHRFADFITNGQLDILHLGIGEEPGYFDFFQNKKNSVWNSFDKAIGMRENADIEVIPVEVKRIDQVIEEKGMPYYMKIDIEGNDITCLNSLLRYGGRPKFISVEVNYEELITRLNELGYTQFKIIEQTNFVPLELPELKEYRAMKKHKEFKRSMNFFVRVVRKVFGNYIDAAWEKKYKYWFNYSHPYGSSGPFAEALPGRWLNFDDTLKVYHYYKEAHSLSKSNTGYNYWIDIHAKYS